MPEATAKSVLDMSKAAVGEYGGSSCPVIQRLSTTGETRAEDAIHDVSFGSLFEWMGSSHGAIVSMRFLVRHV